jgi:hypothetical protein
LFLLEGEVKDRWRRRRGEEEEREKQRKLS